ncbi:MAG: electron transfer flavoprotein subunit alpha/FixB family protein [Syntrophomonas sp.]
MAGVWILAEDFSHSLELMKIGRELANQTGDKLGVFVIQGREPAADIFAHGAEQVYLLSPLPEDQGLEAYIPIIVDKANEVQPDIFLIGASMRCKEMAARIASRLNTGLCSDCISLTLNKDNELDMERLVYGGAAVQKVKSLTRPQMATIPRGVYEAAPLQSGKEEELIELPLPPLSKLKLKARKPIVRESADLKEARIVICAGRGLENKEDLKMVRELAEVLGAEIGCTRPISEELHWLPEDTCIGLSGIQVKPELYIGVGVSGQIQHITGIRDARIICSINKDENAPIFDVSNYGIAGDLYKVVPQLIQEFNKALK